LAKAAPIASRFICRLFPFKGCQMKDAVVTFSDVCMSTRFPAKARERQIMVDRENGKTRVMVVDSNRYLVFLGEVSSPEPVDGRPLIVVPNQLTAADDDRVKMVDGEKYTVIGFDGQAIVMSKPADKEVLAGPVPGMWETQVPSNAGAATVRKIGAKYQVFITIGNQLHFFAEKEVGPGLPSIEIPNRLTLADMQSVKIIDGREYVVSSCGGTMKIESQLFDGKQPPN
jgi:hypothetical protein